ncbi:Transposon Ty3-G Gag-Pol poly, partial [Paramuricea clavata]
GKFLVDSGSPITIIPVKDHERSQPSVDSGLKDASGRSIRAYGKTLVNIPVNDEQFSFEATRCDVVRPILGRDFFKGPGRNFLIDIGEAKLLKRTNPCFASSISVNESNVVCALALPSTALNPCAPNFYPLWQLKACRDQAEQMLETFCNEVGEDNGNSPALFAPIRIDTGGNSPVFSKSRPLAGEKAKFVQEKLRDLVNAGILEEVIDPIEWSSPIHVAPKKLPDGSSGGFRLCGDYRRLNVITDLDR